MKIVLFCFLLGVLVYTATGHAAAVPTQVGDGGQALPPCNAAWWGSSTVYQGHVWKCAKYANHWTLA